MTGNKEVRLVKLGFFRTSSSFVLKYSFFNLVIGITCSKNHKRVKLVETKYIAGTLSKPSIKEAYQVISFI